MSGSRTGPFARLDGLAPRVAAFLSLALLPVGLIAVYQTREFQQETESRAALSLLAITSRESAHVQQAIERALGAAESLGVVSDLIDDPATCSGILSRFVEERDIYAFIGLLPAQGPVVCSSSPEPFELTDRVDMADLMANPRVRVRANGSGTVSGRDVLIVTVPLMRDDGAAGAFDGYLGISLPRGDIVSATTADAAVRPLRLVTFNPEGRLLTSLEGGDEERALADLLPAGTDLMSLAEGGARVFLARDELGEQHVYTVAPLVPDVAYAMGIWSPQQAARGIGLLGRVPLLFPLLMWIVSLIVAFWAIDRLVIGRVRNLGLRMSRFGRDRSLLPAAPGSEAARELREIEAAFQQMAEAILHDEARMEHAFRERGILLLEVHHRVKNNLQLISSIISMQARRTSEPQMRAVLRRLQDRVLTLATIYRSLYTSQDMGEVNAADLLRAIVDQEMRGRGGALVPDLALDDITLDADKIVPLSFLAAEAVANALASVGDAGGGSRLSVALTRSGPGEATIAISNTMRDGLSEPLYGTGRGLGQHLIRAFSAQLGGPPMIGIEGGIYRIAVTFPTAPPGG